MKRETQLQAQALADGIQAVLTALKQPKSEAEEKKLQQQREMKRKGPISPQRKMLHVGMTAVALLIAFTALCSLLLLVGLWVCWQNGYPQVPPLLLAAYAMAEALFPLAWKHKYNRFNRVPEPHAPSHPNFNPRHAFDEFVVHQSRLSRYICIRDMLQTWFWHAPLEQIKRGNVADLITYGFWYKSRQQLEAEGQGHLPDQLVDELERAWGIHFAEGHNKELSFMAHLWQPLRCSYRPLAFYLLIEYLFFMKHVVLLSLGFRAYKHAGFKYYVYGKLPNMRGRKEGQQLKGVELEDPAHSSQVPILFLHGVGMGLFPYMGFIAQLACTGQPVVAFECNHLGMRWVSHIPDADEVVEAIAGVLRKHDVPRMAVAAHSYGTLHSSRLLQMYPQLVQSICLIDPVNFNMFTGKLIHNFVYRPDKTKNLPAHLVARDIHHAASVSRRFYWSLLNLWPHQLPRNTMVVLSGRDELVPVPETITMLQQEAPHSIVLFRPSHKHAQFIKDNALQKQVVWEFVRTIKSAENQRKRWRAYIDQKPKGLGHHHEERTQAQLKQHDERVQAQEDYTRKSSGTAAAPAGEDLDPDQEKERVRTRRGSSGKPAVPLSSIVGPAERSKSGDVWLEIKHSSAMGGLPRTISGRRHYGGTMVRSLGTEGVVALERMVENEDGGSSRSSLEGLESSISRGRHSRACSRGSHMDWGKLPSFKEDLEEKGARITRAASDSGGFEVVADATAQGGLEQA
mmetsp:Transcript_5575/g.15001  ORF Transcript_5575/g.15001 Transcript_5575/m.15001 type:complete len:739 (-) Transcript_5575:1603-3819(-)